MKITSDSTHTSFLLQVLDWNESSIEYYKRKGAVNLTAEEGWIVFRYGEVTGFTSTSIPV
jgi:hypothetical protein